MKTVKQRHTMITVNVRVPRTELDAEDWSMDDFNNDNKYRVQAAHFDASLLEVVFDEQGWTYAVFFHGCRMAIDLPFEHFVKLWGDTCHHQVSTPTSKLPLLKRISNFFARSRTISSSHVE